jgi:hypothetical protein
LQHKANFSGSTPTHINGTASVHLYNCVTSQPQQLVWCASPPRGSGDPNIHFPRNQGEVWLHESAEILQFKKLAQVDSPILHHATASAPTEVVLAGCRFQSGKMHNIVNTYAKFLKLHSRITIKLCILGSPDPPRISWIEGWHARLDNSYVACTRSHSKHVQCMVLKCRCSFLS